MTKNKKCTHILCESDGKWCSRRVLGTIGFSVCVISAVLSMIFGLETVELMTHILYASGVLLGLTTIDFVKNVSNKKSDDEKIEP